MARRRRGGETLVSLFPFLSVLACVIGALTLLLAALAVGRLGGGALDTVRQSEELAELREAVAAGEAELVRLEAQLRASRDERREEEEIGRRLAALGLSAEIPLEELERVAAIAEQQAELAERSRALARREAELRARTGEREQELARREQKQVRAPILIDPSGIGREWRPYLVECAADWIDLHSTSGERSFRVPRAELARSEDFRRFLRRVRAIRDGIVIFLIRPDGVAGYLEAVAITDEHRVRNAKLPLPGDGELDWSLMQVDS